MIPFLLDTLIATGVLIALVLVLRQPVARAFGPQFAYALWLLPLLRFVMPPILLPASLAPSVEAPVATAAAATVPAVEASVMVMSAPARDVAATPVADATASIPLGDIALIVWLGGALVFLAWRWRCYFQMREGLLAEARPVGEVGNIRLVETPAVSAPVAFGVRDKVVALPMFFMALEDREARDFAIAHELAHHRGRDLAANFLAQPILALHWFNPLAWLAWRAMRRDQEAACDARVVAAQGRAERARYAQVIASFAAGPRLALAAPMACPMLGEKSIIHRLRSLTRDEISHRRRVAGRTLLLAGSLALPFTGTVTYAANEPEAEPEAVAAPKTVEQQRMVIVDVSGGADPKNADLHTRTVTRDGRTVVLKTDKPLSDEEVQARVEEAFDKLAQVDVPAPPAPVGRGVPAVPAVPALQGVPPVPPVPQIGAHPDPEFERRMEAWSKKMEKWGEEYGERYAKQMERRAVASARAAPEVVESCAGNPTSVARNETTADGRQRIVVCHRVAMNKAIGGLRQARDTIANNRDMDPEIRADVLEDLDAEIARIEGKS